MLRELWEAHLASVIQEESNRQENLQRKTNEKLGDMQRLLLRSKPLKIDCFVKLTDFKHYIAVGVLERRRLRSSCLKKVPAKAWTLYKHVQILLGG
jgi:hypothetical protein